MIPGSRAHTLALAALAAISTAALLAGPADAGPATRPPGSGDQVLDGAATAPAGTPPEVVAYDPLPPTGSYIPSLAEAGSDTNALNRSGCQQSMKRSGLIICVRGDTDGRKTVLLAGGSHATHWYPAVNRLARERGWRLLTAVKAGCRLDLSRDFAQTARDVSCKLWLQALVARVKRNPPDIVITTGTITSTTDERLPAGYLDMWRRFNRLGIRVIAIRDTPRAPFKRVDCLRAHRSEPRRCAVARNPTLDRTNPLVRRRDELPRNVLTVDVTDAFCTATTCPAVSGSYVIYRDRHHITETYSRRLASVLGAQIP